MITRMNNMILMLDMSAIIIVKIMDIPCIPPINHVYQRHHINHSH